MYEKKVLFIVKLFKKYDEIVDELVLFYWFLCKLIVNISIWNFRKQYWIMQDFLRFFVRFDNNFFTNFEEK